MGKARRSTSLCLASLALLAVVLCGMCGCKPTDFFTEIILSPYADTVDETNPSPSLVNSPDAEEESSELAALDWTEESPQASAIQNLVTYSKNPNTDLSAHHSIFDLEPRFRGIEASDGVRFVYDAQALIDGQVEDVSELEPPPDEAESTSQGNAQESSSEETASSQNADDTTMPEPNEASGEAGQEAGGNAKADKASAEAPGSSEQDVQERGASPGEQQGDADSGENPDGESSDPVNPGSGESPDPDSPGSGESPDPYGGYEGTVPVYNPGDAFSTVHHANSVAVIGSDASVLVQALGGQGSICAMTDYAYRGLDSNGQRASAYLTFSDVFAAEVDSSVVLWDGDGSSPEDIRDINALVTACGQDGVIFYDQRLGDQTTLFSDDQRRELYAANIQLAPIDLSTVDGILDASRVIGDALSESETCALDSKAMSDDYIRTVNDIVSAVAATHGGTLGYGNYPYSNGKLLTKYDSCPVWSYRDTGTWCYIATDSEAGLSYSSSVADLDVSRVVLFEGHGDWESSPLIFWKQVAGLNDTTAQSAYSGLGLTIIWPLKGALSVDALSGGSGSGALSRWLVSRPEEGTLDYLFRAEDVHSSYGVGDAGLPSQTIPYLIVCGSDGRSSGEVKQAVVDSMESYYTNGTVTPYSILPPLNDNADSAGSLEGYGYSAIRSAPFLSNDPQLGVGDVVRENPRGLLSSWTEGSMEGVLEPIWLAELYSHTAAGHPYTPVTDMSGFSVNIGGVECTDTRSAVLAFYRHFYHLEDSNIEELYADIVPDNFEGLL